jgi:phosphate transport system permease protein
VVLGFLAAIVIAPAVEDIVPELLCAALLLPLVLLLGATAAQLLPASVNSTIARLRVALAALAIPLAVFFGFALGPSFERFIFSGDFKLWLSAGKGSALGAWTLLLLPVATGIVMLAAPAVGVRAPRGRQELRYAPVLRLIAGGTLATALALVAALGLSALGADPRATLLGTYVQRNAMVVGFVMGFAIIPIIYTITEDALSSVPEHLRAGSLALGATRWQTAVRIVVPTATSGIFSALMIGLGRAVGETMIVLMAAGNTPIMDWNIFDGLRSLSANIAVELPEAVRDSTHYRVLFLTALVLFAITFTLNTVAELVRLRFRRRSYQL